MQTTYRALGRSQRVPRPGLTCRPARLPLLSARPALRQVPVRRRTLEADAAAEGRQEAAQLVAPELALRSIEVDPDETETFVTEDGAVVEAVDEEEAEVDHFLESTYGNLHFAKKVSAVGISNVLGLERMEDIIDTPYLAVKQRTEQLLRELSVQPSSYPDCLPQRGIYCSRTVNLRSIQAIGYDMDYTTVHYDVRAWEGKAYEYGLQALREMGCPVDGLHFDPDLVIRGLIMDTELGNLVKADRFGFIKRAMHGTKMLSPSEV